MDKKRKRKFILIIVLLIIFCTTVGALSAAYLTGASLRTAAVNNSNETDSPQLDDNRTALDGMAESKTSEQVLEELQKEQINVTDQLSSHIQFSSGKVGTIGSWTVENPASNNVIMQCEVILGDKLVAKSASIRPDQHIESLALLDDVEAGAYDVTAYVNYFTLDTSEYISKAGYQIKLTVQ